MSLPRRLHDLLLLVLGYHYLIKMYLSMQEIIEFESFECLKHLLDCLLKCFNERLVLYFDLHCFIQKEVLLPHPLLLLLQDLEEQG